MHAAYAAGYIDGALFVLLMLRGGATREQAERAVRMAARNFDAPPVRADPPPPPPYNLR